METRPEGMKISALWAVGVALPLFGTLSKPLVSKTRVPALLPATDHPAYLSEFLETRLE